MNNLERDLTNKTVAKEISKIIAERMSSANELFAEPKPISCLTRTIHRELISLRVKLLYVVLSLSSYSFINLFFILPFGAILSAVSLIGGISLVIVIHVEVFGGAGNQIETEFNNGGVFSRSFKFIPSFNTIFRLILFIGMSILIIIIGFSGVYIELSRMNKIFFNTTLDGVCRILFDYVTLCNGRIWGYMSKTGVIKNNSFI